jgi:hypothetical protein
MLPALIIGGVAGTYLHRKFPGTTEAVAGGIVRGTAWVAKKTAQMVAEHYAAPNVKGHDKSCLEYFDSKPKAISCVSSGNTQPAGCTHCADYFDVHYAAATCAFCGAKRPDGTLLGLRDIE